VHSACLRIQSQVSVKSLKIELSTRDCLAAAVPQGDAERLHAQNILSAPDTTKLQPTYRRRADGYWLIPSILLLIAVPLYCARGRIFWEDEMLGFLLLRDPSFHHMITAWLQGADGGGFSFYLTGRLWFDLFGSSVRSFRMYTEVCFAVGFIISWVTMRRFYAASIVTLAWLSIWLVSPVLIQHLAEGRFYGLFMVAVALAIYMCVLANERRQIRPLLYLGIFLANALLITSHLLGVVYSFCVVVSMVWLDRDRGRLRPKLYLVAMASWLLLIPSLPAIRASGRVGKPFFWTTQPDWVTFVSNYTGFTLKLGIPIAILLVTIGIVLAARKSLLKTMERGYRERRPIYVVGLLLFLIPVVFYFEGFFGPALCISRYLQPVALATVYLVAELITIGLSIIPTSLRTNGALKVAVWTIFFACVVVYDFRYRPHHTGLERDYTQALTQSLPQGIPVVCEDAFSFTEIISRQHDSPVLYTYLLDWKNSLLPQSPRLEVTQYHLMENWKKVGYFSGSIQYAASFFREHPEFYIISMEDVGGNGPAGGMNRSNLIGSQLHNHLAENPQYEVRLSKVVPLGELKAWVWLACRRGSDSCK
jgi:hypothetical protein